jgi:hypothetical protein
MKSDTGLRTTYIPRGAVMATAEAIPEGPTFESAVGRSLTVHLLREQIDVPLLSELQANRGDLAVAMRGYVEWVMKHYERLRGRLPAERRERRDEYMFRLAGSHSRTPGMAATLVVGLRVLLEYALEVGAIDQKRHDYLSALGEEAILEASKKHTLDTSGDDPATRFVEMLRSMFKGERAYAKDREDGEQPDDWAKLGWKRRETDGGGKHVPEQKAKFVGWADSEFLYLDKVAAYAAVSEYASRGDLPFGIKPRALWQSLKRKGISLCKGERNFTQARIEGHPNWVVQMPLSLVLAGDEEDEKGGDGGG